MTGSRVTTTTEAAAPPYRWVIEASLLLLNFSMGLSFLAVAPLFPLIIDTYEVSRAATSLLVGVTTLGVALAIIPCSILAARLGTRWSVALGGLLMGSMALAPFANSFVLLLVARVGFALGAATTLSAVPPVVMRWFPARELPLVNGANVVAQSLGVTTSMFLAPRIASAIDWDIALFSFACVSLTSTAIWLLVGRNPGGADEAAIAKFHMPDLLITMRSRPTWLLGIGFAGGMAANVSFASWLPTFYNEEFQFTLERAGTLGALLALFGIAGSLLGSTLPVRYPKRRPFLIGTGLLLPIVALGTFTTTSPAVLYPSLVALGILSWIAMPLVFTIPMELPGMRPECVGIATALVLAIGNTSGFLAPLMVGLVRDATGAFSLGLIVAASLGLVLAAAGWLMPETGRGTHAPAEGHPEPAPEQRTGVLPTDAANADV